MDERRLSLKEVVQQGWDPVRDQFLEQLRGTIEGLLEAERDRGRAQAAHSEQILGCFLLVLGCFLLASEATHA